MHVIAHTHSETCLQRTLQGAHDEFFWDIVISADQARGAVVLGLCQSL
jgi:hypothetical protein